MLKCSLTTQSFDSYKRAMQKYREFATVYFPNNPILPITVEHLVLFIAFCMHKNLALNTVSSYVSMLNCVQGMAGFHDFSHNFVIKKSLEGYRKQKAKADSRIPITPVILKKLIETLQHMNLLEFTHILLKAMCLLAFHAFLRVGEIIVWLKNKQYYCFQLS
jgi:hypothetical protein